MDMRGGEGGFEDNFWVSGLLAGWIKPLMGLGEDQGVRRKIKVCLGQMKAEMLWGHAWGAWSRRRMCKTGAQRCSVG